MSRHVVFNENHFPFQEGFLDTRNPIKIVTNDISIGFPSYPTGVATDNIDDATGNVVDQQEPEANDNNTIEDEPVVGENSEPTNNNNLRDSSSETENPTEAVGRELVEEITQTFSENNSPPQQNITNTH